MRSLVAVRIATFCIAALIACKAESAPEILDPAVFAKRSCRPIDNPQQWLRNGVVRAFRIAAGRRAIILGVDSAFNGRLLSVSHTSLDASGAQVAGFVASFGTDGRMAEAARVTGNIDVKTHEADREQTKATKQEITQLNTLMRQSLEQCFEYRR